MKRFLLVGACVLSASVLSALAVRARCGIPPAVGQPGVDPVNELVTILSDTKAKDTYLAAVVTLGRMGARAQPAVGAILRNGERLGVFSGVFDNSGGVNGAQAQIVLEALAQIVQGHPGWAPPPPPGPPPPVANTWGGPSPAPTMPVPPGVAPVVPQPPPAPQVPLSPTVPQPLVRPVGVPPVTPPPLPR